MENYYTGIHVIAGVLCIENIEKNQGLGITLALPQLQLFPSSLLTNLWVFRGTHPLPLLEWISINLCKIEKNPVNFYIYDYTSKVNTISLIK